MYDDIGIQVLCSDRSNLHIFKQLSVSLTIINKLDVIFVCQQCHSTCTKIRSRSESYEKMNSKKFDDFICVQYVQSKKMYH